MSREELEHFAAKVADTTCIKLFEQGMLKEEDIEKFTDAWTPVMVPRDSILKRLWNKLFNGDNSGNRYLIRFVQIQYIEDPRDIEATGEDEEDG